MPQGHWLRSLSGTVRLSLPATNSRTWALLDQAAQSATNFLTMMVAARTLRPAEFAVFSLAVLATLLVASFHRAWVTQPLNVLGNTHPETYATRLAALWRAQWLLSPLAVLSFLALSILGFASPPLLISGGLYLLAFFGQELHRRAAYTGGALRRAATIGLIIGTTQLLLLTGLSSVGEGYRLASPMAMMALAQGLGWLVWSLWTKDTSAPRHVSLPEVQATLVEQFSHSQWVIASQVVYWIASQAYPFMLAPLDKTATANFAVGSGLLNIVNIVRLTLANYLPAKCAAIERASGRSALVTFMRRELRHIAIGGAVMTALLMVAAGPVVTFIYGHQYQQAPDVVRWLWLGVWASLVSVVLNAVALAIGQTRGIFTGNLLGAAFSLTAGLFLVRQFGLWGAIAGNVLGYGIPAVWQAIGIRRTLRTQAQEQAKAR